VLLNKEKVMKTSSATISTNDPPEDPAWKARVDWMLDWVQRHEARRRAGDDNLELQFRIEMGLLALSVCAPHIEGQREYLDEKLRAFLDMS
jgi:hypothetical protein